MTPRTGRPLSENPKNTRIQIRLDKQVLEKLDKCAAIRETSRSDIIRQGIDLVHEKLENKEE